MSKTNYQFMFLVGAALFSLSALPGIHNREKVYSANLSSECELGELKDGQEAVCDMFINGRRTTAIFVQSDKDPNKMNMITEVECRVGCENGIRRGPEVTGLAKNHKSLKEAAQVASRKGVSEAEKAEAEAKRKELAEKELERNKELCFVNDQGEKFETKAEQLDCRIGKLAGKTDAERKAYYKAHIREKLMDMLTSTRLNDRSAARELVDKLGISLGIECRSSSMPAGFQHKLINMNNLQFRTSEAVSDRGYIQESACDMLAYGAYTQNQETIKYRLDQASSMGLNANHWQIRQDISFATNQERVWGDYFHQRGFELRQPGVGPDGSVLLGNTEKLDLQFQSNYQAILKAHANLLSATGVAPGTSSQGAAATSNPPQFVNMNRPGQGLVPQNSARPGQGAAAIPQAGNVPYPTQAAPRTGAVTGVTPTQLRAQSMQMNGNVPMTVPMSVAPRR